jgi:hypothetical protein
LTFNQARKQNNLAVGKFERVVMDVYLICVQLSKAGYPCAIFRFAAPGSNVTKTTLEFGVIVERDLCSRRETHRYVWFSNCGEASRQAVGELPCHQLVTDLCWSSGDIVQTVITHGDDLRVRPLKQ